MLTISQLGYSYTQGQGCPSSGTTAATVVAQASAPQAASAPVQASQGTTLARGTTEVPIEMETAETSVAGRASAAPNRATVTITGLQAHGAPGVMYNVYLANDTRRREQIGVIDFFGFGAGNSMHDQMSRSLEFDATEAVRVLGLTRTKAPKIVFEPTTGVTDSTPAAASAAMAKDSTVTFQSATLRLGG